MDGLFGLPRQGTADVQVFLANAPTSTGAAEDGVVTWRKKSGATMVYIFALAAGGGGGNGFVGAVSAAGGGAGGGSGAQVFCEIPAILLPDSLYVMVGVGGSGAGVTGGRSIISILPGAQTVNNVIVEAKGGLGGGSGSAGGGGSGGTGGAVETITGMPLCPGNLVSYAGKDGSSGVLTGIGTALTIPATGIRATGGASGAGLNGSGVAGSQGGSFTVTGAFPAHPGGIGGSAATVPPIQGNNGYQVLPGCTSPYGYWYGGSGGGSSHGSATGAGLFGGKGGDGGLGSGGGGGGGALTTSTQGLGGRGGDGLVIIIQI